MNVVIREEFAIIAAIIRDSQGVVQGSTFVKIEAVQPLEGEAATAKLGMEFAWQKGFRALCLKKIQRR